MLSKCSNPSCKAPFRSLREGKLFHFEPPEVALWIVRGKKPAKKVEHYWLCERCCSIMTLTRNGSGISVVPLPLAEHQHVRRAAAS